MVLESQGAATTLFLHQRTQALQSNWIDKGRFLRKTSKSTTEITEYAFLIATKQDLVD